jgi:erythromycin esterase-like protein
MGHSEDILKLRKRVLDAVGAGIIDNNLKEFYEATLLQILNETERQRQTCATQAENLRKQAEKADGQAAAFASMGAIIYSVLHSYISQHERALREEAARAVENAEKEAYAKSLEKDIEEEVVEEKKEKSSKKKL